MKQPITISLTPEKPNGGPRLEIREGKVLLLRRRVTLQAVHVEADRTGGKVSIVMKQRTKDW